MALKAPPNDATLDAACEERKGDPDLVCLRSLLGCYSFGNFSQFEALGGLAPSVKEPLERPSSSKDEANLEQPSRKAYTHHKPGKPPEHSKTTQTQT